MISTILKQIVVTVIPLNPNNTNANNSPHYPNADSFRQADSTFPCFEWSASPKRDPLWRQPVKNTILVDQAYIKNPKAEDSLASTILNIAIQNNKISFEEVSHLVPKLNAKLHEIQNSQARMRPRKEGYVDYFALYQIPGVEIKRVENGNLFNVLNEGKNVIVYDYQMYGAPNYMFVLNYYTQLQKIIVFDPSSGSNFQFPLEDSESKTVSFTDGSTRIQDQCQDNLRHVYFSVEFTDLEKFKTWVDN